MSKDFILLIIPPMLVFILFIISKPKTRNQKIYYKAKENDWFVTAKTVKRHYATKDYNNSQNYNRAYVTYEYEINGKKRIVYNTDQGDFPSSVKVYYLKDNPRNAAVS